MTRGPVIPGSLIGLALCDVSPCDGGRSDTVWSGGPGRSPCGCRYRVVLGFGRGVDGCYDLECPRCGAWSSMRPADVAALVDPDVARAEPAEPVPVWVGELANPYTLAGDHRAATLLEVAELAAEVARALLERDGPCPDCDGGDCPACDGTGYLELQLGTLARPCPDCRASGQLPHAVDCRIVTLNRDARAAIGGGR